MRHFPIAVLALAACAGDPSLEAVEQAATAPAEIAVSDGNHVVASWQATGFQVYECTINPAGRRAWTLRAPLAVLAADDGSLVAYHFGGIDVGLHPGPYWQSALDGSRVHGALDASLPNPGAIALLRLRAVDTAGAGIFAPLSFIQRLDTAGGLAPTGPCGKLGNRAYVPYSARYVFWAASLPRPEVPDTIAVPAGYDVALVGHATGVQIYECAPDTLTWRLRAPRAELFDDDGLLATHFGGVDAGLPAGPYWQSPRDGSRVHGGNAVSSPNPGNVALLRLAALDTDGNGVFSRVAWIHRLATAGGVGPTGACPADARMEVPYQADYYFYVCQGGDACSE